ncbi:type VI secretion system membrane subunit TssM [Endozoicomonas sp. OPT23]|uniref:type VI secretion system membrane subunit TssM n=1 Tax=Endozoicomonas sp. OPT23 TaxID=2072845 RepID=UPI00129B8D9F|nr:type VI secretion system membrane subunit TssM [Endozoicomonas sp. OPT23]MRI32669.1 type VI secretion system membrane subunit TssM [Endozoicomonas sp. OPT23]
MKKILITIFIILLIFALSFVWGAAYIWPETFESLKSISARAKLTLILLGIPLLITAALAGLKSWRKKRKAIAQDQELQYLRREKRRLNENWKKLTVQLQKQSTGYNIYNLPWVMMLGDSSAGKSSWLQQAGFERIQTDSGKDQKADNRNDDIVFWISEHAVVLEMADHFLTEESGELDTPIMQHLYSLLKRHRPRQPLTGIIVAQAASQLVMRQPLELQDQARKLRRRLKELDDVTGLKLPVWIQVTLCDQLEGFQACFDQTSSNERSNPLGIVLEGYQPEQWHQKFDDFQRTLTEPLSDLLHGEKDVDDRQSLSRFLLQMTLLKERLQTGLDEIYNNRHHSPDAWVAGVWLSSTAQEGDSYNLLANELGRNWGFQALKQQSQFKGNNSYFIRNFFPRIAMKTLLAVGENTVAHQLWRGQVIVGGALVFFILLGGASIARQNIVYNQQLQNLAQQELLQYQNEVRQLGDHAEPEQLIEPLLRLRELASEFDKPRKLVLDLGLFDNGIAQQVHLAYNNQLQQRLFLPLAERVNDELTAYVQLGDYHEVFSHLLHYMMLFESDIRNNDELNEYLALLLYEREELSDSSRDYLFTLLDDLWTTDLNSFEPEQELVASARSNLDQRIDNQLVYDFVKAAPANSRRVDIRKRLGSNFKDSFEFKAGFDGYYLPVMFTREGYDRLNLTEESELLQDAMADLVKVKGLGRELSAAEKSRIVGKVRELYFLDYIRIWKSLVNNIELNSEDTLAEQLDQVQRLYQGEQPALFTLISAVADQTQLQAPETAESDDPTKKLLARQAEKKAAKAIGLKGANRKIARSAGKSALGRLEKQRSAVIVNEAFSAYATFFIDRGEQLTEQFNLLDNELQQISSHPNSNQAYFDNVTAQVSGEVGSLSALRILARQDKTQASVWLDSLADSLWKEWLNGAGQYIQEQWRQTAYKTWRSRLANRFPFASAARQEAREGDFVEFLKPGGELELFVTTYLKPFVEPGNEFSSNKWRLKSVNGEQLSLSNNYLRQLEQVDRIRESYFSQDGQLDIRYRIRARRLDSRSTGFNLRDGNGNFNYSHGPRRWQERSWPSSESENLSLNFDSNGLHLARASYSGPWAWQRFVADSKLQGNGAELQLSYTLKSYEVVLDLEVDRRGNPFDPKLTERLKLPGTIVN